MPAWVASLLSSEVEKDNGRCKASVNETSFLLNRRKHYEKLKLGTFHIHVNGGEKNGLSCENRASRWEKIWGLHKIVFLGGPGSLIVDYFQP